MLCLAAFCLFEAANFAHFTYIERIGVAFELEPEQIGMVLGLGIVLGIPGGPGVVLLGPRFGRFRPILLGVVCELIALILLLTASGIVTYTVANCLRGMAWAFVLSYLQAIAAEIDPGGGVAAGIGTPIGGSLGPGVAAMLIAPGYYADVLWASSFTLLVVTALAFIVTSRKTQVVR